MKYPSGKQIQIGDKVWWNEGAAVGQIIDIHETPLQCQAAGVEDPGIYIAYDGSPESALYVAYPENRLADDGVEPLTVEESESVQRITEAARSIMHDLPENVTCGVWRDANSRHWKVIFYQNQKAVRVVEVDSQTLSGRSLPIREANLFYDLK